MKAQNNKAYLVYATDDGKVFAAWSWKDGTVHSFEHWSSDNISTIVVYDGIEEFVNDTTWQDWIVPGIQDKKVRSLVGDMYGRAKED